MYREWVWAYWQAQAEATPGTNDKGAALVNSQMEESGEIGEPWFSRFKSGDMQENRWIH
jgi:hypothetical protein